jgi:hypothetical protein
MHDEEFTNESELVCAALCMRLPYTVMDRILLIALACPRPLFESDTDEE